jgi:elongation factor Ts
MSTVSMEQVKELREKTQVGMLDCKKALEEANGDMEKAIEILRKKGTAVAAKRADNATNNGRIESWIAPDFKVGALVEIACETDFSANTPAMQDFAIQTAEITTKTNLTDPEQLLTQKSLRNNKITLKEALDELIAKIAEKIKINRVVLFKASANGLVNSYIHPGSTVGVMVEIVADKPITNASEDLKSIIRDICMQIAVTKPLAVTPENLDKTLIEKERTIAHDQLKDSKKPAQIIEKIIDGKLNKFYEDVCLLNQLFIKNDKISVAQYLKEVSTRVGMNLTIKQFIRFGIGR